MITTRTKSRRPAKRILMLCEGETEEIYLKGLQQSFSRYQLRMLSFKIKLCKHSDQASLVKQAIEQLNRNQREKTPYDAVWAVFDHDNCPNISKVLQQAKKHGIKLGYSRISIEVWFILHFEKMSAPFLDGNAAVRYLEKRHLPHYHKTKINHFAELQKYLPNGKANAAWLREIKSDLPLHEANPITTMDDLVSFVEGLVDDKA